MSRNQAKSAFGDKDNKQMSGQDSKHGGYRAGPTNSKSQEFLDMEKINQKNLPQVLHL